MKPIERRRLLALSKRWQKDSRRKFAKARRMRSHAGHSCTPQGTGDEGWVEMLELYQDAFTLQYCANNLRALIETLTIKP